MVLAEMEKFALKKGIDVLTASDFTHPLWFREIKAQLTEDTEGMYKLKTAQNGIIPWQIPAPISSDILARLMRRNWRGSRITATGCEV